MKRHLDLALICSNTRPSEIESLNLSLKIIPKAIGRDFDCLVSILGSRRLRDGALEPCDLCGVVPRRQEARLGRVDAMVRLWDAESGEEKGTLTRLRRSNSKPIHYDCLVSVLEPDGLEIFEHCSIDAW